MEEWLICSLTSCILYSTWTLFNKQALRTIDSTSSSLIQLPFRVLVTILTALRGKKPESSISLNAIINNIGELNLHGTICAIIACAASVLATFLFGDALQKGGDASSVAVITGCYPALSYIISVILGLEQINSTKLLGVCLAIGSCYCFAIAK